MFKVTPYDSDGNAVKTLCQWDKGIELTITNTLITKAYNVHFANKNSSSAYVVESTYSSGAITAQIPDALLREVYPIMGYVYIEDDDFGRSILYFSIRVQARVQPADYVYEDSTEYILIADALEEIEKLAAEAAEAAEAAAQCEENIESVLAGSHTMYLSNYNEGAFSLDIDVDGGTYEGAVQVTSTIIGVAENEQYIQVNVGDAVELNTTGGSAMRIFGYNASSGEFNLYTTSQFQALGSSGYYIASFWKGVFYNAHIDPDLQISYNGTTYSAGKLFDTESGAFVPQPVMDYVDNALSEIATEIDAITLAGTKTIYLASGALALTIDSSSYEGTVQVTSQIICVTEDQQYIVVSAGDATELNTKSGSAMRVFGYDESTGTFNLYTTSQFQALGSSGYYIASLWNGLFYNAHINPDFSITYDGTKYSAGELFYEEENNSFVEKRYKDAIDDAVDNISIEESAGTKTMYLMSGAFSLDIDSSYEGTIQVTTQLLFATEDQQYISIAAGDATELNSASDSTIRIFGYDADTGTLNLYKTSQFQALGSNGYYIASFWKGVFYNAHIHPDVAITYNGTAYSAGELFDTDNASYVPQPVKDYVDDAVSGSSSNGSSSTDIDDSLFAGTRTIYLASGALTLTIDSSYEGTVQVTSQIIGVTENQQYLLLNAGDATELNTKNGSAMRVFGYDTSAEEFNLYTTSQFQALGSSGYYIASFWKGVFYNAHMNPDFTITYNGTTYSAGELSDTDSASYVSDAVKDYVANYADGSSEGDDLGDIVSPSHWDCMEGRQLSIFYDCLSRHEGRAENYRMVSSDKSLSRNAMCMSYTPSASDSDFTLTLQRLDEYGAVAEKKAITVQVHHPLSASLTKNVCICGDSLVDNDYLAAEVYRLLEEDADCTINQLGTRGSEGGPHEGRAGWKWATYLQGDDYNSRSNAFWDDDNGRLDFQKYCEDNGYEGIDYFLIALGTNDVSMGSTLYADESAVATFVEYAKEFVDALLDEETGFPDCKVGIGLPAPGAEYSCVANSSIGVFKRSINTLNLSLINTFDDGAYHENVTCFAHGLRTDRKHAYPYTEEAVNERFAETCVTYSDRVHPTENGYYAWADGYYCQIRAWLEEDAEE